MPAHVETQPAHFGVNHDSRTTYHQRTMHPMPLHTLSRRADSWWPQCPPRLRLVRSGCWLPGMGPTSTRPASQCDGSFHGTHLAQFPSRSRAPKTHFDRHAATKTPMPRNLTKSSRFELIRQLVESEVATTPARAGDMRNFTAIVERRADYQSFGVRCEVGGSGAERTAGWRSLVLLHHRRFITRAKRGGSQFAKLTAAGDAYARALVSWPQPRDVWATIELISALADLFGESTNAGFIGEWHIANVKPAMPDDKHREAILHLEECCRPFLARGLIESYNDVEGRLGYRLTPAGKEALAAGQPKKPKHLPAVDKELAAWAATAYYGGLENRRTWKGSRESHVAVPLSCGLWPKPPAGVSRE